MQSERRKIIERIERKIRKECFCIDIRETVQNYENRILDKIFNILNEEKNGHTKRKKTRGL